MEPSQQSRDKPVNCISSLTNLKRECGDRRLRAAIDFVLACDLKRKFPTEQLSQHLHLSTTRVHHLFHEWFGHSPAQLFKLRRLQVAKELLASTFMSVKEVMAAVGLNDLSHFVRDFKQMYGMTPTEFRTASGTMITSDEENGDESGVEE